MSATVSHVFVFNSGTSDVQPQTPQTPGGAAWITEPAQPAAPAQFEAQPQTPKTPTGVSERAAAAPAASTEVTAAAVQVDFARYSAVILFVLSHFQTGSTDVPPATPKTPTGISWVSEPAAPVASTDPPQVASADAAQVEINHLFFLLLFKVLIFFGTS